MLLLYVFICALRWSHKGGLVSHPLQPNPGPQISSFMIVLLSSVVHLWVVQIFSTVSLMYPRHHAVPIFLQLSQFSTCFYHCALCFPLYNSQHTTHSPPFFLSMSPGEGLLKSFGCRIKLLSLVIWLSVVPLRTDVKLQEKACVHRKTMWRM